MNRPKNPTEKVERKTPQPSATTRQRQDHDDYENSKANRRSQGVEAQRERILNEDEQMKDVNYREENAQTRSVETSRDEVSAAAPQDNEIERLEAGDDNNEVHPRPPVVN